MKYKHRRKSREIALKVLYQIEITGEEPNEALSKYWSTLDIESGGDSYAKSIIFGVYNHLEEIDSLIMQSRTRWRLDRISLVDKAILRLGIYELLYEEDLEYKIIINEAVELAKKYGDINSKAFVNGILDEVARKVRRNEIKD